MKAKKAPEYLNEYPDLVGLWEDCGTRVVNALLCAGIKTRQDIESNLLKLHVTPNLGSVSLNRIIKHFDLDYTNDTLEHKFIASIKFLESNGFKVTKLTIQH